MVYDAIQTHAINYTDADGNRLLLLQVETEPKERGHGPLTHIWFTEWTLYHGDPSNGLLLPKKL
jgi:hypothetical protein